MKKKKFKSKLRQRQLINSISHSLKSRAGRSNGMTLSEKLKNATIETVIHKDNSITVTFKVSSNTKKPKPRRPTPPPLHTTTGYRKNVLNRVFRRKLKVRDTSQC